MGGVSKKDGWTPFFSFSWVFGPFFIINLSRIGVGVSLLIVNKFPLRRLANCQGCLLSQLWLDLEAYVSCSKESTGPLWCWWWESWRQAQTSFS